MSDKVCEKKTKTTPKQHEVRFMSAEKIYTCNICREYHQPKDTLTGVYFNSKNEFEFRDPRETDGVHICKRCLKQLKTLLEEIEI